MDELVMRAKPRILYVDDEPILLEVLGTLLATQFEIVTADNADLALHTLMERGPFDIVLSDFAMPQMNGAEFLARTRTLSPHSVRILLTGHASMEGVIEAINRAAIFRFVAKPCAPGELMQVLQSAAAQMRLASAERSLALQVLDDATERARFAEKKLESLTGQLLRAEQLASLGTLASSIGHELNNVMTTFGCTLDFVCEAVSAQGSAHAEDLETLDLTRKHILTHARNLLRLGRPAKADRDASTDLVAGVNSVIALLRSAGLLRGVLLEPGLPDAPALVPLSRTEVEQLLINLIKNSVDAVKSTKQSPRIEVSVALANAGRRVVCSIRDNGHGIPAARLPHIFEPFFTTKPADRGTGLGLFVVRNLIEGAGGKISVASDEGQGAAFTFELPVAGAPMAALAS